MEQRLRKLFAYQRFENNEHLSTMLSDALKRYDFSFEGELSDDDVSLLNAAGTTVGDTKSDRENAYDRSCYGLGSSL